jgi:hypothetical protein
MRRTLVLALAALTAVAVLAAPAAATTSPKAKITVVHGIPGDVLGLSKALPVDVCLAGGTLLLAAVPFKGNNAAAPLQVPAGTYSIEVRLDAATDCAGPAVLAAPLTVAAGKSYTAIAALTAGLIPGAADQLGLGIDLFAFENSTRRIGLLEARATLGHFADAPAVDIYQGLLRGPGNRFMSRLFGGVPNGVAAAQDFWFGPRWFGLAVSPSDGPRDIAVGPVRLTLERRANNFILAVGSLDKGQGSPFGLGSFDFITFSQR